MFWKSDVEYSDDVRVLLRNKPDQGTALGQCVALGIMSLFTIPFFMMWMEEFDPIYIDDWLGTLLIFGLPFWIIFVLLIEIYWGFLGSEIVYYSDTVLYIQQKQSFRRDMVISWDAISSIEPYDEPIFLYALPTHDPTICIQYKTADGRTKKSRFGYHLSPKQREIVIDRIQELLVENFG